MAHVLSQTQRAPAARAIAETRGMSVTASARVRRRLDPDEPGLGPHRLRDRVRIGHVHQRTVEPPAGHHLAQELRRAVVGVLWGDDVLARQHRLEHRRGGRHAGREGQGRLAALERGERGLELAAGRVVAASVDEPVRKGALGVAGERGGEVNWRRHRARRRIGMVAGVNCEGLDAHGWSDLTPLRTHAHPASTSECSSCRTPATPSTRNRALVSPGPDLDRDGIRWQDAEQVLVGAVVADGQDRGRGQPVRRERRYDPPLVHAIGPDLDHPVAREISTGSGAST